MIVYHAHSDITGRLDGIDIIVKVLIEDLKAAEDRITELEQRIAGPDDPPDVTS
jgi:hypothetical protein